jgi:oligoendopeptidase F
MLEGYSAPITDQKILAEFVKALDNEIHRRGVQYGECLWDTYLGRAKENLNVLEGRIAELLLDPDHLETVRQWREKVDDAMLDWILDLFERALLSAQVVSHPDVYRLKNEINAEVIRFRPEIDGKQLDRSDLRELMLLEPDRDLRRAGYHAVKPLHNAIVDRCVELLNVRNSRARDLGYDNFMTLGLPLSDIYRDEILQVFNELEPATHSRYYDFLDDARSREGYDRLEPWDVSYLIQKRASLPKSAFPKDRIVDWTLEMAESLGFEDSPPRSRGEQKGGRFGIHFEFGDIPFGGVCFGIDPPRDIRILMNPRDGLEYVKVMFHEFGHALQDRYVQEEYHIAKSDTGPPFGEGMAEFLEGIGEEKGWLASHTDLTPHQIDSYRQTRDIERIAWLRRLMAGAVFEFEAIANPIQDLNALSHELGKKYAVVSEEPSNSWAASQSIMVSHPLYVYSYIIADCLAAQLRSKLSGADGELFGNREVAPYLIEKCYRPGGLISWRDKVQNATGNDIRADELLAQFRAGRE